MAEESIQVLVANIGSTSFKFRLFAMPEEKTLAQGGAERIGSAESPFQYRIGDGEVRKSIQPLPDYGEAFALTLQALTGESGILASMEEISAIGFKPVMARGISGTTELTEEVLQAMEVWNTLAPAHNPPYVQAVRSIRRQFPNIPLIGTFETAFYDQIPAAACHFAIPQDWYRRYGIRRFGFHGASHRFVSERAAFLLARQHPRIISCHLGGSSSLAAVRDGKAVESSWGMTPQSGLPQNNRVGDFDSFALLYLLKDCRLSLAEVERVLMKESGLKGIAGTSSGDLRDILAAMDEGNENARLALEVYVKNIRKYIGQFLVELNGADALVFTGGIGENSSLVRAMVCADLDRLGILLNPEINRALPQREADIAQTTSPVRILVIPTSEETIIAREAYAYYKERNN